LAVLFHKGEKVITCSKELRAKTQAPDIKTIVGIEYQKHLILAAEKKEVINSLADGNNVAIIDNINREFAEKQQSEATVLLNKPILLHRAVHATGLRFDGILRVDSVGISEGIGSTLVILNGIPLDLKGKRLQDNAIDIAIIEETYVLYTQ
jgi:hypothetical protein